MWRYWFPGKTVRCELLWVVLWIALWIASVCIAFAGQVWIWPEPLLIFKVCYAIQGALFLMLTIVLVINLFQFFTQNFLGWRERVRRSVVLVVCLLVILVGLLYGPYFSTPQIRHAVVTLPNLPPSAEGFKILHLSDTHFGPLIGLSTLKHIVSMANKLEPSMIVFTGNIFSFEYSLEYEAYLNLLRKLNPPYGVYYVTGTTEYLYRGGDQWPNIMKYLGFQPLLNAIVTIKKGNDTLFDLAGVPDLLSRFFRSSSGEPFPPPDIPKTIKLRSPHDPRTPGPPPLLLLAHNPRHFTTLPPNASIDLQLSGHTLGGMIFPVHLLMYPFYPVLSGVTRNGNGTILFVNQGIGSWLVPFRLGSQAEMVVVELRKGEREWVWEERGDPKIEF
eukprot:TRINITY_DN15898_c0_g1_i1.p1 TRINITY_DN15898_c0_g1~~TRINITY_DN15898_c0_g1_i1.p1  ORF type:complete len:395 (+),score=75.68 TRINITY_DN15898_c0_g1_i1:23-1186(+)